MDVLTGYLFIDYSFATTDYRHQFKGFNDVLLGKINGT